jgi:signal transduction histidine kinase
MTGYAFAALGLDVYPYPLLLLPAYPLVMVYGILRYQVMVVNEWARRAVAFTLLAASGTLVIALLAALPLPLSGAQSGWPAWLGVMAGLVVSLSLVDPFRRLAMRIVYPGSEIDPTIVDSWRGTLSRAGDFPTLFHEASAVLGAQLRMPVAVVDGRDRRAPPGGPSLVCTKSGETWHVVPNGWEAAPPGPRAVATLFATVLTEAVRQLDLAIASAALERERQRQARLAELGTLAAIVAHDIRNPLNIIAMAATAAPAETRREIGIQVQRVSQLAQDLLDYAKSWQIDRQRFDLAEAIRAMAAQHSEIALGGSIADGLTIGGDPRRIRQVLANLIDNARAARAGDGNPGHIAIDGERSADGWLRVHICDDGPGIPPDIRESLFQPFVSRRPEGTGLGLAIVARIMEAHGGRVALTDRPGWSTCFTLSFPPPESA